MDEFEIIRRYFEPHTRSDSVVVGVGDDGAILRPDADRDLVTVVDTIVAGVHFPESLPAVDIGYRAVAVNASDIAAMGGRPRWMTLALTLDKVTPGWLQGFCDGIFLAAENFDVELVGGDITRGGEIVISVQVTGDVLQGSAMTRDGAKPGDGIYVSGTLGDAALGLSIIESGGARDGRLDYLVGRVAKPDARIGLGQAIAVHASAAIDLSDGLFADLDKLLTASGVAGTIELSDLPTSPELRQTVKPDDAFSFALGGGDDYELCFTAADDVVVSIGEKQDVPVTRIGTVNAGSGLSCTLGGEPYTYDNAGYRHFR